MHPILGEGILELTDIKSSPYPGASVVPDYCRATYDRRLLVGETRESVLQPLQALIDEMKSNDAAIRGQRHFASDVRAVLHGRGDRGERFFPGWVFDEDDEFVQAALRGTAQRGIESGDHAVLVLHQRQPLRGRGRHQDHRLRAFQRKPGAHHR
jgi:acetylornithine deacetylase/succinyl-diaminopimelate desuccinylase-like protein